jgi:molybdopterin-guanine dinucleotide biosynthesis protein A
MSGGEVCILAGGLSSRMGREKSGILLRGKTLLGHVRAAARQTPWPVRVIRRDLLPRCGPLGGIYTALHTTTAPKILFLACDMPFVPPGLLQEMIRQSQSNTRPIFARSDKGRVGFPFVLSRLLLPLIERLLTRRQYSLHTLACKSDARILSYPADPGVWLNVNTPGDLVQARKMARRLLPSSPVRPNADNLT